jgi:hypothetical protein
VRKYPFGNSCRKLEIGILLKKLVPGRGKGGECPGTSAGQAKVLTAGDMTAATSGPAGVPVTLAATWGWSITPTRMASAPDALSAKVAAWANIVFMDQPSLCFRCTGAICAGSQKSLQEACQLHKGSENRQTSRANQDINRFNLPISGKICQ